MALKDIFSRGRKPLDGPETGSDAGVSPVPTELEENAAARKKQRMLLAGAAGIGVVASSFWIFGDTGKVQGEEGPKGDKITVSTNDMLNRNLSEQEWMAASENRFQSQENQLRSVDGTNAKVAQLSEQLEALRAQNQSMTADGQRVVSAYQSENEQLRRQINDRAAPAVPPPGPAALYGAGMPTYQRPDAAGAAGPGLAPARSSEVKMVSFTSGNTGTASKVEKGNTVYTDSPNYLPPNSFATAKVIVGVDAAAGVQSQTDPLPVVLRITGPARSVLQNGKLLTTKIQGCLINGAARGELSSEKVYVKLQKMTCPQPGGRYAVSEVKGFIAFGGKTGVRGRVVSREGGLVSQAFIAGLFGGFGRGFAANSNNALTQPSVIIDGKRQDLSMGDIAKGGLGEGISQTGDMVSKYLIERAEQYQPVIEMPTGIDVEIVFLEGVYVRN
ncbi:MULTISPECIES: TraB/VirB10 family protein [unclassified Novosphingobium]|uniref:TraB/VirB10 family protein n=1 Tax=unclassified Novosphingobium TaxID=2644732 RepID=UPI0006C85E63|nr:MULTISPECIES: TraB/VirB10 family protein [unclassified Novosphingobium]KPH67027.1 conjugal transfer protein TraB [Novosphingobium sp. ST904]MPS71405.1 conjugal transfer protein TraB [Novosphingobium sp.]TCM28108.1 conjugal transfer pilus assembly protein TraB [Novosphingobium sp. ST904]